MGTRLIIAFGLAIVLLVANAVISFQAANVLITNNARVVRTQLVIETLGDTFSAVKDAETSQRGFLISGDESFLDPYHSAKPNISQNMGRLKELTADNPDQLHRLETLEGEIQVRLDTLERNIKIRREGGLERLIQTHLLDLGEQQMNAVRQTFSEIRGEEDRLLQIRTAQSQASARNTLLTFIAANALVLGLLGLVYILIRRDVAERRLAAERLQAANDLLEVRVRERTLELADANTELERSNRELQDFAFVASHDLQEPLRKIQAFGDRLRSKHGGGLNAEAQDYLDRMQNAARRMHTLINDLLTFSRVTTKAQPFVKTDLGAIARDVLGDLEERVRQTGGRVDVGELPTVEADPLQMRQLFQNLIGNALKFHKPGVQPIIKVNSKPGSAGGNGSNADRQCQIIVEDNGIGFDEKYLDRIFTPFQRLHGRGEYEGTGIGLAVCRKIVERHGGTLTASSRPREGSVFIITLPVKQN